VFWSIFFSSQQARPLLQLLNKSVYGTHSAYRATVTYWAKNLQRYSGELEKLHTLKTTTDSPPCQRCRTRGLQNLFTAKHDQLFLPAMLASPGKDNKSALITPLINR